MRTATGGGALRAASPLIPALLCAGILLAGCESDPAKTQTIYDQDQVIARQKKADQELREKLAVADKALAAARAEVDRLQGRDQAYTAAQQALGERIKELEGAFPQNGAGGDSGDISIERIAGGFKFVVQGEILFRTGEADLSEEGKAALAKIAGALKGRTEKIRVEGHTDNVPIVKPETKARYPFGNLDLSLDRALRVADALIKDGIEAARVSCGGFGEFQPRADNGTAEGKKKNRRVEILVQAE